MTQASRRIRWAETLSGPNKYKSKKSTESNNVVSFKQSGRSSNQLERLLLKLHLLNVKQVCVCACVFVCVALSCSNIQRTKELCSSYLHLTASCCLNVTNIFNIQSVHSVLTFTVHTHTHTKTHSLCSSAAYFKDCLKLQTDDRETVLHPSFSSYNTHPLGRVWPRHTHTHTHDTYLLQYVCVCAVI